ncbi:MAG: hypothetical protein HRT57_06050 [Crocinitomicaceae bacterium]|nr:hypothetical protein [Crocinitomicaceae bacterium]
MKIYCLIASVILSFSTFSQKSYYFSDPLPSATSKISSVEKKFYGTYKSKTGTISYQFDAAGVSIISTSISSISRKSIRESSVYDVRGGYIHGVLKNDSVPCILEDEYYYFGIRNVDVFIGGQSQNVLAESGVSSIYFLNIFENGNYTPMQLEFKGGKLTMRYFEYDLESTKFDFIEEQKVIDTQYQKLVVLSPTVEEFKTMRTAGVFDLPKIFKK